MDDPSYRQNALLLTAEHSRTRESLQALYLQGIIATVIEEMFRTNATNLIQRNSLDISPVIASVSVSVPIFLVK
jgi:hypothetical protein